jgi:predicted small metal-binding protein
MAKIIRCECGFIVEGGDDDELVSNANDHMKESHPELAAAVTREQLLAIAEMVA